MHKGRGYRRASDAAEWNLSAAWTAGYGDPLACARGRAHRARSTLTKLVPEEGFEPSLSCPRRILSPLRLPFRHSGTALILTLIAPRVKPRRPALKFEIARLPSSRHHCRR